MADFSVFDYYYRDASNYKAWGSLLLESSAVEADTQQVAAALNDYDFFIAEQLGIPPVYEELWAFSDGPTDDDHVWHTFDCFRDPREEEMLLPVWGSVGELVARFAAVKKWDEALSPHWDSWI